MSPITTTITMPITTIPRKSVNMVAELALWIPDTTERQEDYSAVAKDATTTAVALDTKARAAQRTVIQLESELAQSHQSRIKAKTQADYLSLIALKPPSDFGADTLVGRIPGRLTGESLDRLSITLQSQKQPIRLDEDQLTTDTTDLEMTKKILDEDTAAFEDTAAQDCLVCQTKVVVFEELEVLAKAKDVISEKTDDSEYRDNRSMLSSSGGSAIELTKSENSIGLTQLASRVVSTMHAETSNGDDPFAKVKGLISDMITRLEEKASEDLYLMTSMISLVSRSWPEVMNIHSFDPESNTINYMEMLNPCKTGFDACSLQPTNGVSGEYAEPPVISKYQEIIGQDLGMKSAHGTNPDSAVVPHIDMKIKWIDDSQGVPLDELKRTRQETEDVEENKTKSLIIVDMERAWVDKADENSQSLEMYNAMRQTTENEREAKDRITEQANKYARNEGRKVENEMLSVKMRLTQATCWSHAKSEDDAAEKYVSNYAKKAHAEATQMIDSVLETYEALKTKPQMRKKVQQIEGRREVLEKPQEFSKENRKDDTELRDFAARFSRQDTAVQLQQDTRSPETAQLGAPQP